jgi:large subunit ribosomal protein L25
MSQDVTLRAEPRTVVGKKVKALRREGLIPGVVYGPVVDGTIQVSVEQKEFLRIYKAIGLNSLMTLEWDGGSQPVFIREVQVDPVRWNPLHIDFFAPNLRVEITTGVPVTLGEASSDLVGIINQVVSEVQVRGLPASLPNHITADISGLTEPGQHVVAGDLEMPEGIVLVTAPEEVLISVLAPTMAEAEEETAEEAEAAEEAAESVPATEVSGGDDSGASEE